MNCQIFLFDKELHKEAFQPGVGVPVNAPEVIAWRVRPVIGKFNRLPAFRAAPFALQLAGHRPPAHNRQPLEFLEEGFIKETVGWKVGWLDGWMAGRLEGWKIGRLDGWMVGRLEDWIRHRIALDLL